VCALWLFFRCAKPRCPPPWGILRIPNQECERCLSAYQATNNMIAANIASPIKDSIAIVCSFTQNIGNNQKYDCQKYQHRYTNDGHFLSMKPPNKAATTDAVATLSDTLAKPSLCSLLNTGNLMLPAYTNAYAKSKWKPRRSGMLFMPDISMLLMQHNT